MPTISADSLQNPVTPVTLPTPPPATPVQQFAPPPNTATIYNQLSSQAGLDQKATDVSTAHNAVTQEQANLDSINANLKGISDSGQQANLQLESGAAGKDVTSAFLGKQQAEVTRQAGIQSLPLQAQAMASQAKIASLQGNETLATNLLNQAQSHVDSLFKVYSTDAQNQYDYQNNLYKSVYDAASKDQQNQIDAKRTADAQAFTMQQNQLANGATVAKGLMQTQPQLAAQIMALDPTSKTYQADLARLASQAKVDPMVALDIQNKILSNQKLRQDIFNGAGGNGNKIDQDVAKQNALQNAADAQTVNSNYQTIVSIAKKLGTTPDRITAQDINKMSNADMTSIGKALGRMQMPDVARAGGSTSNPLDSVGFFGAIGQGLAQTFGGKLYNPSKVFDAIQTANSLYQQRQATGLTENTTGQSSTPSKGQTQSYNGANYTFDGTNWVKNK